MTVPRLDLALGRVEAASGRLDTKPSKNADPGSNIQSPEPTCRLCGGPIRDPSATRPRLQHRECSRFRAYLGAAVREAVGIGAETPEQARAVRRLLLAAANALPTRWQRGRDERGRFQAPGKGTR